MIRERKDSKEPEVGEVEKSESQKKTDKLIEKYFLKEDKKTGRQLKMTLRLFLKYTGGVILCILIIAFSVISTFADYFNLNKLLYFIEHFDEKYKHLGREIGILWMFFLLPVTLVLLRIITISVCTVKNSRKTHNDMMIKTLYGDLLGFHDRIESGRLLNRFSNDMDEIDKNIMYKVSIFLLYLGYLISDLIIGFLTIGPWILIPYAFYYALVFYYQNLYVRFKKDLYRLEAITRTPIVNCTTEILDGRMLIKIFDKQDAVMEELRGMLEENSKNLMTQNALTNWFTVRVSIFNVLIVQLVCFIFMWFTLRGSDGNPDEIKRVILFMPFVLNFIWNIDAWINQFSAMETCFVSLERCQAFQDIPSEPNYKNMKETMLQLSPNRLEQSKIGDFLRILDPSTNPKHKGSFNMESESHEGQANVRMSEIDYDRLNRKNERSVLFDKGHIEFSNVVAQYPTKTKPALSKLNLDIKAGEKIGIVGQTGSGKSTVIKMLSQYLAPKSGQIKIDGYDVTQLDLQVLRSQMLILSQEVALFDGTIRENIQVAEIAKRSGGRKVDTRLNVEITDEEIIKNMISFGFSKEKLEKVGLDFEIQNNGGNLSQGEQQLIALMKAIYTTKKIIILDEATSNIDYHSEQKIMDFFYDKIEDKTLVTVAHRLNTVLRCDRILVLEEGKVVELDTTQKLLNDKESHFAKLYSKLTENMKRKDSVS